MNHETGKKIIFFAYKGKYKGTHDDNVESIKHAIAKYNQYQKTYEAKSWEDYKQTTNISADVLRAIQGCEVFVCDLTYFNHNVLFELGYAIGKNKKILILLNPNLEDAASKYRDFFLKGIRYTGIENAADVQKALQQSNYEPDLLEKYINVGNLEKKSLDLLYIKSKLNNQPALDLSDKINSLRKENDFSLLVDDPLEISYRPESWYFQNIYKAKCIIIHFWGSDVKDAQSENARNSFFAGLACGLGQKVLLVAPAKFVAPLDYYEILSQYESSSNLVQIADAWLMKELLTTHIEKQIEVIEEHQTNLIKLGIGHEVAEYEKDVLLQYFVETSTYHSALKKQRAVIVGRKGSGKTAIYIKLLDELSKDNLSYIINLKPEADELIENASLSDAFKNEANKNYFFVSAWKLTIFSKLAYSIYEKLIDRGAYAEFTREEESLIDFVRKNEAFMKMNVFGVILEICRKVSAEGGDVNSPTFLGDLYKEYLGDLLKVVKAYFKSVKAKYNRIVIIADNLDQAWNEKNNLDVQADIIISLLDIENKINKELVNREDGQIDLKIIIFLRKDIFQYILKIVSEPDKLTLMHDEINWEAYPDLLKKVIENRFKYSLDLSSQSEIDNTWKEFFEVKGKDPFELIKSIVTLRPRDVIYFVSQLFDSVINRAGHKVTSVDFANAIKNYTNFLNENLIAETKAEYPEIIEILSKLQEHYGTKLEYKVFSKILDSFHFDQKKKDEFTRTLFERGYMLGFDTATGQPFNDVEVLQQKLKEKKWFVFQNKVYVIAHAKYYAIKNVANKAF